MRLVINSLLLTGLSLSALAISNNAHAGESGNYKVELNKTELLRLPGPATSIIIGNPKIADVTVQASDLLFVIGRGYGETNLIILDDKGEIMLDANLQVVNTLPEQGVRLYNGSSRQTYSCLPFCGPSPVLGDSPDFISTNSGEEKIIGTLTAFGSSNQSTASAPTESPAGSSPEGNPRSLPN